MMNLTRSYTSIYTTALGADPGRADQTPGRYLLPGGGALRTPDRPKTFPGSNADRLHPAALDPAPAVAG